MGARGSQDGAASSLLSGAALSECSTLSELLGDGSYSCASPQAARCRLKNSSRRCCLVHRSEKSGSLQVLVSNHWPLYCFSRVDLRINQTAH